MTDILPLTRHAEARSRQRGIDDVARDLLVSYGRRLHHAGCEIYAMDKAARRRLSSDVGPEQYARIARRLDSFLVVSEEGRVVTCAWRTRRLKTA